MHPRRKTIVSSLLTCMLLFGVIAGNAFAGTPSQNSDYGFWKSIGEAAAARALKQTQVKKSGPGNFIVLSNAGYAKVDGRTTQAALDGLTGVLKVGRGDFSLVEIHSSPITPLWFAIYARSTGLCAYLEVAPEAVTGVTKLSKKMEKALFSIATQTVVTADEIYKNPVESAAIFDGKIFNGNEFRIVTIINGVLAGAPPYVIRSTELHDHYCPGVTSGIFLAEYLEKAFPLAQGGSYFVQSVQPWCKEDALLAILNTTPGKKGYHVSYPTDEDKAKWTEEAKDAADIIYRQDPATKTWDGIVVGVGLGQTDCPAYNNSLLDKLCADLYHLKNLDKPESYITVIKNFTLPDGVDPKEYARPGVDPMEKLGLTAVSNE